MNLCAVNECRGDGAERVTSPETNQSWDVCRGHKKKVDAGVTWGPLEDRKHILLGQVVLSPPAVLEWTTARTPAGGIKITITTNHAGHGATPFVATLTKEQAFQLATTLLTERHEKPLPRSKYDAS